MMKQVTNTVLMIRPVNFRKNEQTAVNNYYQKNATIELKNEIQEKALEEFDTFVNKLRSCGVEVLVVEDTLTTDTPDSIFPNNWMSYHENGTVGLYPMFAENRRVERRPEILDFVEESGYVIENTIDYTSAEEEEIFLEGTGSVVLDRANRKAYCALSPRADEELFIEFCEDFEYTPVIFVANQTVKGQRLPIYHTNVMLCVAEDFVVVCLEAIDDKKERKNIIQHFKEDGKEIISISEAQVKKFAGNMLQVRGGNDTNYLVMSTSAFVSLNEMQKEKINDYCEVIHSDLTTIETCGGGSARCMLAEVFLPKV